MWNTATVGRATVFTSDLKLGKATPPKKDVVTKQSSGSKPWASYGDEDDFPIKLKEKLQYLSVGNTALDNNADAHFGGFVRWFTEAAGENNKLLKTPVNIPEWEEFIVNSDWYNGHSRACQYIETFYWCAIKCRTGVDKKKILIAEPLDPTFCRLEKRNPKTGLIENLYYSYLMPDAKAENKDECVKYPIVTMLNNNYEHEEFVFIIEYKSIGQQYYPDPHYYSVFRNKWVDIAIDVPAIIHTIYKNEARIKFHVQIPEIYFVNKYKKWSSLTDKDKQKIWKEETDNMDEFLSGAKANAAKIFISMFGYDAHGKEVGNFKIEPIKEFLDATRDLPTTSEADRQILFSMHNHPEALGVGSQGGKGLAGSGSGIRNARQNQISGFSRDRQSTLSFLRFWAKYNQINVPGAQPFYIDTDTSQTLDENPTGRQTIVSS